MKKTIISILTLTSIFSFSIANEIDEILKMDNQTAAEYISDTKSSLLPITISENSKIKGLRAVNGVIWADTILNNKISDDVSDLSKVEAEAKEVMKRACEQELFKTFITDKKGQVTIKFIHDNGTPSLEYNLLEC